LSKVFSLACKNAFLHHSVPFFRAVALLCLSKNASIGTKMLFFRLQQKTLDNFKMNQEDIKNLEKELWDAADGLRANSKLTVAEYKDPLLGLVLLRFAQNRYEDAKVQVEDNLPVNPRTGQRRKANKDDYAAAGAIMLPEKAKYEFLLS
jgi:type I restriction-modification system DNA methylase subunit